MAGFVPGTGLTYFLSLDVVSGSVTDASHPGALAVSRFSFTVSRPSDATGDASGAPVFGPLTVSVSDDAGLAELFQLLWSGYRMPGATLIGRVTGPAPYDAYKLDLEELMVTGISDREGGGYDLTLAYQTVDLTTFSPTTSGGALTGTTFGWNTATNTQDSAVGDGAEPVVPSTAPVRYFLAIDGVDGGSTDSQHRGWFDVTGFDITASAPWSPIGHIGDGRASFARLSIDVDKDAGLTHLLTSAADGRHFASARLEGVTAGPTPAAVYDLTLTEVLVGSVRDASTNGYNLTLDYGTIELVTKGSQGGGLVETGSFGYDRMLVSTPDYPTPTPVAGNRPGEGTPSSAGLTYFLALDGVAGDSTDASHPGALRVEGYFYQATQSGSIGGAGSAGVATFSPLTITVTSDAGLAAVLGLLARGTHISGATLTARTAGTQSFDVYKLDLEDVTVAEVFEVSGRGWQVTLAYRRIELTTLAQTTSGAVVTEGAFGWDTVDRASDNAVGDGAEAIVPPTVPSRYFLLVDGVDGGSTDAAHVGWFELGAVALDLSRASATGGAGTTSFGPLYVTFEHLDGLANLLQRAATGAALRGVRVEGVTAGANPVSVYDLTLSNAVVSQVSEFGGTQVVFDYGRIELMTRGQSTTGAFVSTGAFGFDRSTGTSFTPTSLPVLAAGDAPGDGTPAASIGYRLIVSGVAGDSTEASRPGALLVTGYDLEVTQTISAAGGGGNGAATSTFRPLSVMIANDTGLARMLALLASGEHAPAASLFLPASFGQSADAARIDLGDITVVGVEDLDHGGYTATLAYRQIDLTTNGRSGQSTIVTGSFGWDTLTRSTADAPGDSSEPLAPSTAPARYYLVVDGVDGGATEAAHAGWFEVRDHRLGASAGAAGGPEFRSFTAAFGQDTGLVDLMRRAATGAHLAGIRLEGVTVEASPRAVFDLTLSNVTVERIYDVSDDGFEVTFDYSRIELITRGPAASGATVQTGAFGYDIATATSFTPIGLPPLEPNRLVAHEDAYTVVKGHVLSVAVSLGVLANDEATAGAAVSLSAGPLHGTVQLAADGSFSYTPAVDFSGIDGFDYRLGSGATASDGHVVIQVVPVETGPSTTLGLVSLTAEQQIASTYVAFFGRAADARGFTFWVDEFNRGLPVQGPAALFANIASSFGVSAEAKALYPFLVNPFGASDGQISAFLDTVYDNLFNRPSDAAGLTYWIGQVRATLAAGQFVGSVLVNIMSGAQDTAAGKDITTLMGKVAVSLAYVHAQQAHHTVWAGDSDTAAATALLRDVTSDPQSVLVGVHNAEVIIAAHL